MNNDLVLKVLDWRTKVETGDLESFIYIEGTNIEQSFTELLYYVEGIGTVVSEVNELPYLPRLLRNAEG